MVDVAEHIGIVNLVIRKHFHWARGVCFDRDDLVQAGVVGLLKARDEWDPSKGAWTTIAHFKVRAALGAFVRSALEMKGSRGVHYVARAYSFEDLCEESKNGEHGTDVLGLFHSDEPDRGFKELSEHCLSRLEGRSREIAHQRFVLGWTLQRIGKHHRISKGRVMQLLQRDWLIVADNLRRIGIVSP